MSQKNKFIKIVIPIIIIIVGIIVMRMLFLSRSEPKKEVKEDPGILVQTIEASLQDETIVVKGTGTVKASKEVSIVPQVSGLLTHVSPDFVVGGHFKKDDLLIKIEDIDYVLALEQANAARAGAEYELATIESRARIARTEWERLDLEKNSKPNPLVLYEPQMANAQAALAAADAAVKQAKLALDRTQVKAPFNSRVTSEKVDIGQYVKSGNSIAVLSGTDTVEINVPLTSYDMHWLNIPLHGRELNGPDATVSLNIGGKTHQWKGHILRSTGQVDPKSRMMQIVIEVSNPYGLANSENSGRPALAIGTFVDVKIKGKELKNVFVIPRITLRDNATVWVMGDDNKLSIKSVNPVRIEKEIVVIDSGLEAEDRIVVTNISGAANGMKLRAMD
jgi:RND family efflux transporter MFP subunit